jgi:hypothetical protein
LLTRKSCMCEFRCLLFCQVRLKRFKQTWICSTTEAFQK